MNIKTLYNNLSITFLLLFSINKICSGQIKSYEKTAFGVSFNLDAGKMNICLVRDDIIEIKYTSLGNLPEKRSLVVEPVRLI
ncbi:MAG: hypothetical protein ABI760_02185 [Ferruginibacter sp.]